MPVKEGGKNTTLVGSIFFSDGLKASVDPRLFLNQVLEFSIWFSRCA